MKTINTGKTKQCLLFIIMKTNCLILGECLGSNTGSQLNKEPHREKDKVHVPNDSYSRHSVRERKIIILAVFPQTSVPNDTQVSLKHELMSYNFP